MKIKKEFKYFLMMLCIIILSISIVSISQNRIKTAGIIKDYDLNILDQSEFAFEIKDDSLKNATVNLELIKNKNNNNQIARCYFVLILNQTITPSKQFLQISFNFYNNSKQGNTYYAKIKIDAFSNSSSHWIRHISLYERIILGDQSSTLQLRYDTPEQSIEITKIYIYVELLIDFAGVNIILKLKDR